MSTAADYVDRVVDVVAFAGVDPVKETLLTQSLDANGLGGEVCTGIQKLSQRWLIEFLTDRGSMLYLPLRGCDFMGQLWQSELRTTLDCEQAFHLSAAQVAANLRAEETTDMPADERYSGYELVSIALNGDQLSLRVYLLSQAGTTREVILPVPFWGRQT